MQSGLIPALVYLTQSQEPAKLNYCMKRKSVDRAINS
jgi:hypothetical protein